MGGAYSIWLSESQCKSGGSLLAVSLLFLIPPFRHWGEQESRPRATKVRGTQSTHPVGLQPAKLKALLPPCVQRAKDKENFISSVLGLARRELSPKLPKIGDCRGLYSLHSTLGNPQHERRHSSSSVVQFFSLTLSH